MAPTDEVSPTSRDKNKYCKFHRDHGHDIKNCYALKNKIVEPILCCYLGMFVRKKGTQPSEQGPTQIPTQAKADNQPIEKPINMIS